jgi:hypothetical protein
MMTGSGHMMMHQVRMEILVGAERKSLNICGLLTNMMKLANSGMKPVDFRDDDEKNVDPLNMPSKAAFGVGVGVNPNPTSSLCV